MPGGDSRAQQECVQKGIDLRATDIQMYLYKMRVPHDGVFRTKNFFSHVMGFGHEKEPDTHDHVYSAEKRDMLWGAVRSRQHIVRSLGIMPLYVFDDQFYISVTVHTRTGKRTTSPRE